MAERSALPVALAGVLALVAAKPASAEMPLSLKPTGEGAALSTELANLSAELQLDRKLERERIGGAVGLDLGTVAVHGAYNDTLAEAFERGGRLAAGGSDLLIGWLDDSSAVAVASEAGPLKVTLAGGRAGLDAEDLEAPLLAGELGWVDETCGVVLRAARNAEGERLLGAEARLSLDADLSVELGAARAEETGGTVHMSGIAVERDELFFAADRIRTELEGDTAGARRVAVDYSVPVVVGQLSLRGQHERDAAAAVLEGFARWGLKF